MVTSFDIAAIPDDEWETLVGAGIVLAHDMDTNRWALGDLGCKVQSRYGQDDMGKFATEIGIANAQTFRDYTRVARRYESSTRNAFVGSTLTFSHFRAAIRAGEDAELWLARAADETWTSKQLQREIAAAIGKPVKDKLYDGPGLVWQYANESRPYLVLDGDVSALVQGARVIVRVYAAGEGAE